MERVVPPPGDCGLYCEIDVVIITEILAVQWFPAEFSFFFFDESSFLLIVVPALKKNIICV